MRKSKHKTLVSNSPLYGIEAMTTAQFRKNIGGKSFEVKKGLGKAEADKDVYDIINEKLITAMEKADLTKKGEKDWNTPTQGLPMNAISKQPYRGMNFLICLIESEIRGWDSPYFLTFKQAQEKGGAVKKGAKGISVVYYEIRYKTSTGVYISSDAATSMSKEQRAALTKIFILKYYTIFHISDCENVKIKLPEVHEIPQLEMIETCESIIENMPNKPKLSQNGGDQAFYRPSTDSVHLPKMGWFKSSQYFYSVAFHELIHSTGHKSRLNREGIVSFDKFGSEKYANEEMVAEIGGAYMCAHAGILNWTIERSADYVENWRQVLVKNGKADKKFIFNAASSAQKAADYILGKSVPQEEQEENESKVKKPKPTTIISLDSVDAIMLSIIINNWKSKFNQKRA